MELYKLVLEHEIITDEGKHVKAEEPKDMSVVFQLPTEKFDPVEFRTFMLNRLFDDMRKQLVSTDNPKTVKYNINLIELSKYYLDKCKIINKPILPECEKFCRNACIYRDCGDMVECFAEWVSRGLYIEEENR